MRSANAVVGLLIGHLHATAALDVPARLTAQVKVNLNQRHQTIDGFGFSQAFQRAAWLHGKLGLAPEQQREVLDLLFDRDSGAGATILRNGIGSSTSYDRDFMKSIAPTSPGSPDAAPDYVWDGYDADQVWLTKEALAYGGGGPKYVYADAWSAPGYMKSNGNDSYGGYLCGPSSSSSSSGSPTSCDSSGDWREAYARYLVQFLRFYRERESVEITHLGWLNEPDLNQTYASMLSDGFQAAAFARILRQVMRDEGFGHVRLVCCEATGWTQGAAILAELQAEAAGAEVGDDDAALFDVYSAHAYSADSSRPLQTTQKVWQTEWADLDGRWNPAWDDLGKAGEGIGWANKIQESLVLGNVSAWLHWIGAEPTPTNSALIQLPLQQSNNNNSAATYSVSGRFWAFAQFSRFVRPGAVRVDAETDRGFLGTSAFFLDEGAIENNSGRVVSVQMINNGHVDLNVRVVIDGGNSGKDNGENSPEIWLTNNENNLTRASVTSQVIKDSSPSPEYSVLVPKRSMVTLLLLYK
ncbi:glycoside hydrolase family 30 protein [Apiospora aurea]|uniref:Glycoside hydrolase family 30 protein n=1 Tax=Apiospora aurea TaxID=335848 RepID=A0ABR1Q7P1_9PEZI